MERKMDVPDGAPVAVVMPPRRGSLLVATGFGVLLATVAALLIGGTTLRACGAEILGFTLMNCPQAVPVVVDPGAARLRALEAEGEDLERQLRLARAAVPAPDACPVPPPPLPPPPPPVQRAEPPKPPEPPQVAEPPKQEIAEAPPQETLKLPEQLSELEGCWVSDRGDLPIVTDDEQRRPVGNVRKCYCFGGNGQGSLILVYTNGVVCRTGISARLWPGRLVISQANFNCQERGQNWGLVQTRIECEAGQGGAAKCDAFSLGRMRDISRNETYQRKSRDECRWNG